MRQKMPNFLLQTARQVKRGETVGIIGRNGCGKSTLLQIVCRTLQPTGGSVEINGQIAALLELGSGFNPEFTGRENVYMNGAILGLSRDEIDRRFDAIARFAGIGQFIEQPVKIYSSGMYVRLAFATAINVDPDILVVDEALSVGDEAFQRKCFARIEDIKDKGCTILFVSHSGQAIVQLCDRAILLDSGDLLLDGRPKAVVSQYQRLANSSAEAAPGIRASILKMRDVGIGIEAPASAGAAAAAEKPETAAPRAAAELADYYDPGLQSQSVVAQEECGARIRDVRILAMDEKPVNVLSTGKRYVIEYWTDFARDARKIGFGIGVRTKTGFLLGGARCEADRTVSATKGSSRLARFEFSCSLLPGYYFVNCHVRGITDTEEISLHRVVDAVIFRVAFDGDLLPSGTVDLSIIVTTRA